MSCAIVLWKLSAKKASYNMVSLLSELYSRELLDEYLSRALNVELENGRLTPIDSSAYVLTPDYAIKMLNIHERFVMRTACHCTYTV